MEQDEYHSSILPKRKSQPPSRILTAATQKSPSKVAQSEQEMEQQEQVDTEDL